MFMFVLLLGVFKYVRQGMLEKSIVYYVCVFVEGMHTYNTVNFLM